VFATPSNPPIVVRDAQRAEHLPVLRARYLALQQEADFALWRAREANGDIRDAYGAQQRGDGRGPTDAQLAGIAALERDAEAKYRELRTFLREHFA
jgi:hypothetical protein